MSAADIKMEEASSSSVAPPAASSTRYTYVVTAQNPTIVTHTAVCSFTSPNDRNLIVCRSNRLEIYRYGGGGIESMHEVGLFGRIAAIVPFRPRGDLTSRLFITTERHKFFVLRWDREDRVLVTDAHGDSKLKIGRTSEQSPLAIIDPTNSWFGLHQYDGLFQMLAVDPLTGQLDKTLYDCKFDQLQVIQLAFLYRCAKPTIVVLSNETTNGQDRRVLKSYTYESKERELKPAPQAINFDQCDAGAAHIIPTVFGGAILIAEETISYFPGGGKNPLHTKVAPWHVTACTMIDPKRYLLGCIDGGLHVLMLDDGNGMASTYQVEQQQIGPNVQMRVEYLGQTSIAHKLQYIDNGFVLVGSLYGDSQLIRLSQEPIEVDTMEDIEGEPEKPNADAMDTSDGVPAAAASSSAASAVAISARPNFVQIVSTFPNLGSIQDMAMIDLDRSGQCQLMTCSGAYQDSSLRIVRNGIGITEEASIELLGITGVWGVRARTQDEFHKYLVQTYANETRMLALESDEADEELALAECEIDGFDANQTTIFAGNMGADLLLQVTQQSARLINSNTLQLVDEFKANGSKITVATANSSQLLIAAGKVMTLLTLEGSKFKVERSATLDEEISCVDITPVGGSSNANHAAICMWRDHTVRIYSLATLSEVCRDRLGDMLARSVLFTDFDDADAIDPFAVRSFLLCGLGDGNLVSFEFDDETGTLKSKKKIALGTAGLELKPFRSRGQLHVFVSCDRPTVISNAHGKLRFSNVHLRDLTHMTPFHAPVFKDCLALVSGTQLMIGHIDEIEKLHIKKVHTNGQARSLSHQLSSRTLGVVVQEPNSNPASLTGETCKIKIYEDQSFRKLAELQLEQDEEAQCICTKRLVVAGATSSAGSDYYIVGTAYVDPSELEPSRGRILVVQVDASDADRVRLTIVAQATIKGCAMSIDLIQGRIVAGVNAKVVIYRCFTSLDSAPGHFKLEKECDYVGNVFVLRLRSSADGQYIMVQDLFKSLSILHFNAAPNTNGIQTISNTTSLEEVARHHDSLWLTAFDSFSDSDDVMLMSDQHLNLMTLRRNFDPAASVEERQRLENIGQWHSGEFINCIARGSLVMNLPTDGEAAGAAATSTNGQAAASSSPSSSLVGVSDDRVLPTHVLGSTSGAILVAAPLSASTYKFFARLEEALASVVKGVGGLSHREWRQFQAERKVEESKAFIDGDLVQLFLELNTKQQEQIANKIGVKLQECIKRVEDASRIH